MSHELCPQCGGHIVALSVLEDEWYCEDCSEFLDEEDFDDFDY